MSAHNVHRPAAGLAAVTILAALGLTVTVSAQAATSSFTDRATFLLATGSSDATGPLPAPGGVVSNATVGSVSFHAPSFLFVDWSTLLPGSELAVSDGAGSVGGVFNDGIDIGFATPVWAAGFDFHQPSATGLIDGCNVNPCADSQFELQLFSGATAVGVVAWTPPKDQATFIGVSASQPFDRLLVRETVGTDDNEFYGRVYTATTAPVPEPAGWVLLAAGLLGLGLRAGLNRAVLQTGRGRPG